MSCSWVKCRVFCWLFTFALTNFEKNTERICVEGRDYRDSVCFTQTMCSSAPCLTVIGTHLFATSFIRFLKADLSIDLLCTDVEGRDSVSLVEQNLSVVLNARMLRGWRSSEWWGVG